VSIATIDNLLREFKKSFALETSVLFQTVELSSGVE
jgi:hypothetical protein